jgi:hypothetical protein
LGRFLSPDPLGYVDGPNLYQAFLGNPVSVTDPYGLFGWRDVGNGALAFGGAVYGFGRGAVNAVGGVGKITYYTTGHGLYLATGSSVYAEQSAAYLRGIDQLALLADASAGDIARGYVNARVGAIEAALEADDAFGAGAGFGEIGFDVFMAKEAVANAATALPRVSMTGPTAFATAEGVVLSGGAGLTVQAAKTGPGLEALANGILLASSGAEAVRKGLAGEQAVSEAVGVPRNAGPGRATVPGTGRGGFRVPDFDPSVTITLRGSVIEVKNVQNLSMTPQLRDLVDYAVRNGATLEIFTNAPSPGGQLGRLVSDGTVVLRSIQ